MRLHDVVVKALGRAWAFGYVLKCVKYLISYIDTRISRRKDIDVKELVQLCDAEEMLSTEVCSAVGVKAANSRGRRTKIAAAASKTLAERLPPGLAQSIVALEEKLHFMKEQASTRAYAGRSKKAPPVVRRSQRILKNKLRESRSANLLVGAPEQKLPLLTLNDNEDFSESEKGSLGSTDSPDYEDNNNSNNANENNNNEYAFVENVDIDELDDEELMARFTFKRR